MIAILGSCSPEDTAGAVKDQWHECRNNNYDEFTYAWQSGFIFFIPYL